MQTETLDRTANLKEESQLVTFLLKDEEFGFDIMSVQEIIRLPKMARVPRTPDFVDGIANLRGVVLPIVDMRTRFGMERAEETDRTRVLVVDIDGVKTGLRVDRVKQVTRVLRSDIEPPPPAIRGRTADYLEGVVKLDQGQRIIMALNVAQVCRLGVSRASGESRGEASSAKDEKDAASGESDEIRQMVTFHIAREEFAFAMERVREILRVETPKQVPDVPEHVLGVLTVRGKVLPIVDLRRLLKHRPLAEEVAAGCRAEREEYERGAARLRASGQSVRGEMAAAERLRTWIAGASSSSQALSEALSRARGLNERAARLWHNRAPAEEVAAAADEVAEALVQFEALVAANIQEDQRIIVVDAGGFSLGLVVDHVNEVLNLPKKMVDPPPEIASSSGADLAGIAKLNDGGRLIMILDVEHLVKDDRLRELRGDADTSKKKGRKAQAEARDAAQTGEGELQLVTFQLSGEEYGVPISQIQEIDRLAKITKVPKAASFVEGVTNLRGEVIPVLDTRRRFELETKAADDRTRIIIVELAGVKTGLVVDSVREVLSLPKRDIAPPPAAIRGGVDQRFISGIGKVEGGKRMVVVLDVEKILSRHEQEELAEVQVN